MVESSESVHVDRAPHEVYRFVADLRNEPAWRVDVSKVPADAPPELEIGRTVHISFCPERVSG